MKNPLITIVEEQEKKFIEKFAQVKDRAIIRFGWDEQDMQGFRQVKSFLHTSQQEILKAMLEEVGKNQLVPTGLCYPGQSHFSSDCFECRKAHNINQERARLRSVIQEAIISLEK